MTYCYCFHFYLCIILSHCRIKCSTNYGALQSFLCTRKWKVPTAYLQVLPTFYCVGCSDLENDYLVSYCGFGTSRDCYIQHLTEMGC